MEIREKPSDQGKREFELHGRLLPVSHMMNCRLLCELLAGAVRTLTLYISRTDQPTGESQIPLEGSAVRNVSLPHAGVGGPSRAIPYRPLAARELNAELVSGALDWRARPGGSALTTPGGRLALG